MILGDLQVAIYRLKAWSDRKVRAIKQSSVSCGVILILATVAALLMRNIPVVSDWYEALWNMTFSVNLGNFPPAVFTLSQVVNEGLMSIFFFSVGLEIKREFKFGHLSTFKQASLPVFAALGGMIFPALIYAICNIPSPATRMGWGIPMATDIAFSLGILSMFSKKVPISLKVFLTTLAVADDLGSIIVIALFYSQGVNMVWIIISVFIAAFMFLLNYLHVYSIKYYVIPSILIWFCFMFSGVHVTIAGVIIAFSLPIESKYSKKFLVENLNRYIRDIDVKEKNNVISDKVHMALQNIIQQTRNTIPPLQKLEYALTDIVNFLIMPLFALANAGVYVSLDAVPVFISYESLGIILGLVIGKPLGICLVSYLLIKAKIAVKPEGAKTLAYLGVGCLGGIGFTMSIFVDNLAFAQFPEMADIGKLAILIGSFLSAVIGSIILLSMKDIDEKYHW